MDMNKAILSVDDDPLVLSSLKLQLGRHFSDEYVMEFAQSAEEALEVIGFLDEDGINLVVIISDFIMPGMHGDAFARKVKEAHPHLEILMLTGQGDNAALENLLEEHTISGLLTKPWGEEELVAHVRAMIALRQ
jgi:CheY-like chemotaxis protein